MRYKAVVSYDGSNYVGWQSQLHNDSIQEMCENALQIICKQPTKIDASGRTDAKVHALGQVFNFDSDIQMEPAQWVKAINSRLPRDIRILEVYEVNPTFHARYDAQWKRYDYLINVGEYNLFQRNYTLQYNQPLDISMMLKAKEVFVGTHDFTAFNANSKYEKPDQVRTIYRIDLVEEGDIIRLSFYGDGFLRHMVRMLSQTLIEVGKGKLTPQMVKEILDKHQKGTAPYNASAVGLYLVKVGYDLWK